MSVVLCIQIQVKLHSEAFRLKGYIYSDHFIHKESNALPVSNSTRCQIVSVHASHKQFCSGYGPQQGARVVFPEGE